jgi:hypothetical protein
MRLPTATRAASAISGSARLRLGPSGLDDRNDVLGRAGLFGLIQCLKLFTAAFATEMGTG